MFTADVALPDLYAGVRLASKALPGMQVQLTKSGT